MHVPNMQARAGAEPSAGPPVWGVCKGNFQEASQLTIRGGIALVASGVAAAVARVGGRLRRPQPRALGARCGWHWGSCRWLFWCSAFALVVAYRLSLSKLAKPRRLFLQRISSDFHMSPAEFSGVDVSIFRIGIVKRRALSKNVGHL